MKFYNYIMLRLHLQPGYSLCGCKLLCDDDDDGDGDGDDGNFISA